MCRRSSQRSGLCGETCCHWEGVGGVSFKHIICQHTHAVDTHTHTHTHTHMCTASLYSFWHPRPGDNSVTVCKVCMRACGFVCPPNLPPGSMIVCFSACVCCWQGRQSRHMAHGKCVSKSQKHLSPSVCVCVFECVRVVGFPC